MPLLTTSSLSLAQLELWRVVAIFFRRFDCSVDPSITEKDMRMYDSFTARTAGGKRIVHPEDLALNS